MSIITYQRSTLSGMDVLILKKDVGNGQGCKRL